MRSKNTDLMNEIKKFAEEYYLEYWKSPSTSEIAGAVGVTRATVYRYLIDMAERGMIDYDGSEIKTDVTRKYTDPGNNAVILDCSVSCGIGLPEEERVLEICEAAENRVRHGRPLSAQSKRRFYG